MTDEEFEDMIKKVPKFLLNEDGRLFKLKCENCGCGWGCKVNVEHFICGVCQSFKERGVIS
jgi:translation initiation factor 2 beta subunit (eIF-2beta)/eIF-5